jgi:hypothetical protein
MLYVYIYVKFSKRPSSAFEQTDLSENLRGFASFDRRRTYNRCRQPPLRPRQVVPRWELNPTELFNRCVNIVADRRVLIVTADSFISDRSMGTIRCQRYLPQFAINGMDW